MEAIYKALDWVDSNILWGIPMLILIIGTGLFVSIRTKFFQVREFGYALKQTMGKTVKIMVGKEKAVNNNEKAISPFEAFCTAVSGTVGTGNIVGVTTAIISGGPGAVLWMWISAFFGMVTKYAEITLAMFFRKKDEKGEFIGGPMYYIEKGAKMKWLAILFAVFTMLAAIGMSSVQANTIQSTWNTTFKLPIWVTAIVIAIFTALVVIGGIKRIGKVTAIIVPFMAIFFIIMALVVVCVNITAIPAVFASIFTSAFTAKSAISGFAGYGIMMAMRYGFARGVFSNEAGLGSSCIAHSTADEIEPVKQGLWGILEIFVDTFIVCTLTALFVLTSGIVPVADGATTALTAFTSLGGVIGEIFKYSYAIILPLFAFSTILAWAVYGEKACQYIFGKKSNMIFNVIYVVMIVGMALLTFFGGDNLGADFVWLISDMTNALMAIPNLIAIIALSGLLVKITKNYFDRKKGYDVVPMLSAYEDVNNELAIAIKDRVID